VSSLNKYLSKEDIASLEVIKKSLNENNITVTCVGLYNHGKSTLLNVLIKDFEFKTFKTADARETSVNKTVTYGNINYIDTPGLNANEQDDNQVLEVIKNSDITLFVHNVTVGEFSKVEIEFLESIKKYWENPQLFIDRTIFVLSRIDGANNNKDIKNTQDKMHQQIESIFGSFARIIALSAEDYRDGMVEKENELIAQSNVKALEKDIEMLSKKSRQEIQKTKQERLSKKYSELIEKLQYRMKSNLLTWIKLTKEQKEQDEEFHKDIDKIEATLKSKYEQLNNL
jgi:GTPase Era involved in 16S rRNA processing